jgi:hypothetical protein
MNPLIMKQARNLQCAGAAARPCGVQCCRPPPNTPCHPRVTRDEILHCGGQNTCGCVIDDVRCIRVQEGTLFLTTLTHESLAARRTRPVSSPNAHVRARPGQAAAAPIGTAYCRFYPQYPTERADGRPVAGGGRLAASRCLHAQASCERCWLAAAHTKTQPLK